VAGVCTAKDSEKKRQGRILYQKVWCSNRGAILSSNRGRKGWMRKKGIGPFSSTINEGRREREDKVLRSWLVRRKKRT